ncbi:MAG: hypothetical protein ACPGR7_03205 [Flavobacteriaceae bacterium]|nr:hypothetical protein [Flavobacteriaceae bacterium]
MNKNNLSKILTAVSAVIGLIGVYFLVRIISVGDETLEIDADAQASVIDPLISFSLFLLYATILITVVYSIWNLIKSPEQLKKSLISLGVLVVMLVVVYATAPDNTVLDVNNQVIPIEAADGSILTGDAAVSASKWVSTGINYAGVLGIVGLVFFMIDFIKGLFK